jgi:hypothetical protein
VDERRLLVGYDDGAARLFELAPDPVSSSTNKKKQKKKGGGSSATGVGNKNTGAGGYRTEWTHHSRLIYVNLYIINDYSFLHKTFIFILYRNLHLIYQIPMLYEVQLYNTKLIRLRINYT